MIGIIDSGIGGATVLKEIRKVLPSQHYIYYSDSLNNPYGEKKEEEIYIIVKNIVDFLLFKGCKTIVLACNTASGVCVNKLREEYPNILFLAIEPAIKVVSDGKYEGLTLVLATPATLNSKKFLETYQKYKPKESQLVPCPKLAQYIEEEQKDKIKGYIDKMKKQFPNAQNFVLGCTHYPLIKKEIQTKYPNARFFDGSIGLAKELKREIISHQLLNEYEKEEIVFLDSSNNQLKKERFLKYLNIE